MLADKEMRNAIDKLCRKTKTYSLPVDGENYGVGCFIPCQKFFLHLYIEM